MQLTNLVNDTPSITQIRKQFTDYGKVADNSGDAGDNVGRVALVVVALSADNGTKSTAMIFVMVTELLLTEVKLSR